MRSVSVPSAALTTVAGSAIVATALAAGAGQLRTWSNLLVDAFSVLSVALGGMLFVAIQQLTGASWPPIVRRAAHALTATLPIAAVLLLSLFFGRSVLYRWSAAPDWYLNTPFVFGRMVLFLALWLSLAHGLRHGRPAHSALFVVVFAISFSLASVDWLLSLTPHWSTTMFAVYQFAGVLVQGTAAVTFIVVLMAEHGRLSDSISDDDLHDLGKLLFAFTTFWAYLWLSQYLLIWYTNLPEETGFYLARLTRGWRAWFFLNLVINWLVPFVVLLGREPKRRVAVLKWVAIVIFVGRWLDLYLTVMPQTTRVPGPGPLELVMAIGCAGLVVAAVSSNLTVRNRHA